MDVSSLNLALPTDGTVPEWVHLVPSGTFTGVDKGRGPWVLKDPEKVIAASMAHGRIALDENHATELATIVGGAAPARGWITELQSREDGIWGRVEWTATGRALMADKAYRWVSPVFDHTKDGVVLALKNVALTNNPNLITSLTALNARGQGGGRTLTPEGQMDKLAICTALGIAGTVDDGAVLSALQTAAEAQRALQAAQARIKELETTHVPLERVTSLQTRLDTLEADGKRKAAVSFVDTAINSGKPLTAARDVWIAQYISNPEGTEKQINALPSINAAGAGGGTRRAMNDAMDGDGLTAEDRAICAKMGTDPKKYADFLKKKQEAEGSAV